MFKTLLVPTDFSPQAMHALEVAAQLARRYQAKIYLLHLLEMPELYIDGPGSQQASELPEALYFMQLAHKRFDSILNLHLLEGIEVIEAAEFNGAFEGVMEYVNKYKIDAIVMGSHGTSGLQELFIGSNAEKVVRHSRVPVLIIKDKTPNFRLKKFLFATDLQEDNIVPVQKAQRLAEKENAELHLVYINTPNGFKPSSELLENYRGFKEYLDTDINQFEIYNDYSIERGILNYAEYSKADLIGIGTHGRKGLAHFFNGSVSLDLVNHALRPVITFNI